MWLYFLFTSRQRRLYLGDIKHEFTFRLYFLSFVLLLTIFHIWIRIHHTGPHTYFAPHLSLSPVSGHESFVFPVVHRQRDGPPVVHVDGRLQREASRLHQVPVRCRSPGRGDRGHRDVTLVERDHHGNQLHVTYSQSESKVCSRLPSHFDLTALRKLSCFPV